MKQMQEVLKKDHEARFGKQLRSKSGYGIYQESRKNTN